MLCYANANMWYALLRYAMLRCDIVFALLRLAMLACATLCYMNTPPHSAPCPGGVPHRRGKPSSDAGKRTAAGRLSHDYPQPERECCNDVDG